MRIIDSSKSVLFLCIVLFLVTSCATDPYQSKIKHDPHYTRAGFFDLHICNWPDKDLFFLAVFSTLTYKNIESVSVLRPNGSELGSFNLKLYKTRTTKNKKTKHIIIDKFPINETDKEGWYKAEIKLKDGRKILARDFVKFKKMPKATGVIPRDAAKLSVIPEKLSWQKVPGAKYYKVSIRDMWDDGKLIHSSKLLQKNSYQLPPGTLKTGGWYKWRIHARDVNEDIKLGDFNHGSLSAPTFFLTEN